MTLTWIPSNWKNGKETTSRPCLFFVEVPFQKIPNTFLGMSFPVSQKERATGIDDPPRRPFRAHEESPLPEVIETDAVAERIELVVRGAGRPGDDLRGEITVGIEHVPEHIPRRRDPPQRRRDRVRNAAAVDRTDPEIPRGGGPSPVERVNPRRVARRDLGRARGGFPSRIGVELRHHRRLVRGVTETEEVPELMNQNHPEIDDARSPEGHPLGAHRGRGHRSRFRRPT